MPRSGLYSYTRAPQASPATKYGAEIGFIRASLEIVEDFDGDSYRAVYTVRFAGMIYVLHAFQKKSKHGIATPKPELDLIERRMRNAEQHSREWRERQDQTPNEKQKTSKSTNK